MLKERISAVKLVTEKIHAVEKAIDDALRAAGALAIADPEARETAKLSAIVASDAVSETGEAIAALYKARAHMVAAHGHYALARDEMGVPARMYGDLWKFGASASTNECPPALQSVA